MERTVLIDMELATLEGEPVAGGVDKATKGLRAGLFRLRAGQCRICWVGNIPDFRTRAIDQGLLVDDVIVGARHTRADAYLSVKLGRLEHADHIPDRTWLDIGLPQAGYGLDERVALVRTVGAWVDQYLLSQGVRPTLLRAVPSESTTPARPRTPGSKR